MDLTEATSFVGQHHQGVLVARRPGGDPHLSNIAYALGDDGVVRISVTDTRAKVRHLRADPRASLHVTRPDFWRWVVLDGRAELSPVAEAEGDATVDELVAVYRAVRGEEHPAWDDFRRAMVADRRLVVRLHPERAYGQLAR
jgi:PPOX class probable F420-dependent enzyme